MATFTLTALPGHHEQEPGRGYAVTIVELLGACLGCERIEAQNLADVTARLKTFGNGVAKQHPDVSFTVSVGVAKGSRKPNGFDAANRRNALGQETWMNAIEKADPLRPGYAAAA